jgi:hypothetical protein
MRYDATRVEPYPKTQGHTINFQPTLTAANWHDAVVEVIVLG